MEYAIYVWSIVAASILAFLLYWKLSRPKSGTDEENETPSLFENITFMKSEIGVGTRRRTNSQLKKRRSQEFSIDYKFSQQHQNVADLLATLGIKNEVSLQQIISSFKPINVGQGVKLNPLFNLSEHIIGKFIFYYFFVNYLVRRFKLFRLVSM